MRAFEAEPGQSRRSVGGNLRPLGRSLRTPSPPILLRLRAARADLDIQSFKEEVAPIRHLLGFFRLLDDPCINLDELPTALLRYYKYALEHTFRCQPFERFIDQWTYDVCRAFLVTKLCNSQQITLSRVLRLLAEERLGLEKLVQAAIEASGDDEQAIKICRFLGQASADQEQSTEDLLGIYRQILCGIYRDEASTPKGRAQEPQVLENRMRALYAFDPQRANLPSPEEAQAQAQTQDPSFRLKRRPGSKKPPQRKTPLAA